VSSSMRIPKPKFKHSPEVLGDIIKANGSDPVRLAHCLQQLGWSLGDAAWAAVNWPLTWMACGHCQREGCSQHRSVALGRGLGKAAGGSLSRLARAAKAPQNEPDSPNPADTR
jgi:hypothetical protein